MRSVFDLFTPLLITQWLQIPSVIISASTSPSSSSSHKGNEKQNLLCHVSNMNCERIEHLSVVSRIKKITWVINAWMRWIKKLVITDGIGNTVTLPPATTPLLVHNLGKRFSYLHFLFTHSTITTTNNVRVSYGVPSREVIPPMVVWGWLWSTLKRGYSAEGSSICFPSVNCGRLRWNMIREDGGNQYNLHSQPLPKI